MGCSSSSSKSGATPPDVNAYGKNMDASMHEYDMARRTKRVPFRMCMHVGPHPDLRELSRD